MKVGDIPFYFVITLADRMDSRFQLFADLFQTDASGRAEGPIVAEIAATAGDRPVDVRTSEPRIDAYPLNSAPKLANSART